MAKPIRIEYDTTGVKGWIPLNTHIAPFEVSFGTEGGTSTVEVTIDDVQDGDITPVAITVADSAALRLIGPVTAIRCNLTIGTTVFKVLQAGIR